MSQLYTYPFTDFTSSPGNLPKNRKLLADIEAAALGAAVEWMSEDADAGAAGECVICMAAPITQADLDAVVAAHDGVEIEITQLMGTSHLTKGEDIITAIDPVRQIIEGTTTAPQKFSPVMSKVGGNVVGECWSDGVGGKLWWKESNAGVEVDVGSFVVPDTASLWVPFMFKNDVDPSMPTAGLNSYILEGATAAGVTCKVRFVSMSLTLEKGN